ncbi:MAG: methionine gamma-lyase family protein [Clostridia bacterium]|nr:methionine gamma-lyase family protein [Clostridia bacterium]
MNIYDSFKIDDAILSLSDEAARECLESFCRIDRITEHNQIKVLSAFTKNGVAESHFPPSTGYGYGDSGRDLLEKVFSDCVGSEDSLIRHSLTCGTHTLAVALFGILRPGDVMLCVSGTPYDTIHSVIGISGENMGSLKDFGVEYRQVDLDSDGNIDFEGIEKALKSCKVKMVYIQRSRGYSTRDSLSVETIGKIVEVVRENSDAVVMVDNCYGEFVETVEPVSVGADIIAGSLIKNPGGGLARTGGYIAGKKELVELCSYRMTTPGLGREVGASLGETRNMFMGLFNSPHVVGEALKTAVFAAKLFSKLGFEVSPSPDDVRHDIIQTIKLKNEQNLIAFCQGLQKGAPVDSTAVPEPWDMPGYDSKVIMSAGAFINGASIELSADAPLREPYAVWMQGGLNFHSGKLGIMLAAQEMKNRKLIGEIL